jgi:hypothetical protein
MFAGQGADISGVFGRELRSQFYDHASAFQLQIQGIGRIRRAPGLGGARSR